jgi:glutamyl/glutaminyl-tRNA synthetase
VKQTAAEAGLKMPQLAIPLRVALLGLPQSPSIDAVLEVLGRERVIVAPGVGSRVLDRLTSLVGRVIA